MVRMVTTKSHLYAGKRLQVGAEFDARGSQDARLLKALGRAEKALPSAPAPAPAPSPAPAVAPPEPVYQTASVSAADPDAATEPTKPKRRQYQRRDMTAEDE